MAHKKHKKRRSEFRLEVIVERNTILHDLAQQSLRFEYADRDMLYYSGNLAEKNLYDQLIEDSAPEIRQERSRKLRQRRFRL